MAKRKPTKKPARKPARRPAAKKAPPPTFAWPSLPKLEQHELDLIGLGLVALAAFFAPVFYLDWNGGEVGEALANAFVFMLLSLIHI